jgi:integral membrane protein
MNNPVSLLRRLTLIEGVSFLMLLGIAMPLKYFAGMPMAVKIFGWAHGLLFVAFCFALLRTMLHTGWSFTRAATVFVASLLPFGPFVLDRRMREWEKEPPQPVDLPESEVGG